MTVRIERTLWEIASDNPDGPWASPNLIAREEAERMVKQVIYHTSCTLEDAKQGLFLNNGNMINAILYVAELRCSCSEVEDHMRSSFSNNGQYCMATLPHEDVFPFINKSLEGHTSEYERWRKTLKRWPFINSM